MSVEVTFPHGWTTTALVRWHYDLWNWNGVREKERMKEKKKQRKKERKKEIKKERKKEKKKERNNL
jgi:hypothetical protein